MDNHGYSTHNCELHKWLLQLRIWLYYKTHKSIQVFFKHNWLRIPAFIEIIKHNYLYQSKNVKKKNFFFLLLVVTVYKEHIGTVTTCITIQNSIKRFESFWALILKSAVLGDRDLLRKKKQTKKTLDIHYCLFINSKMDHFGSGEI